MGLEDHDGAWASEAEEQGAGRGVVSEQEPQVWPLGACRASTGRRHGRCPQAGVGRGSGGPDAAPTVHWSGTNLREVQELARLYGAANGCQIEQASWSLKLLVDADGV